MGKTKQWRDPFIERGCDQPWDEMTTIEMGAYCDRCQHDVVDASAFTREQFADFVKGAQGRRVCARLRYDEHDRVMFKRGTQLAKQRDGVRQLLAVTAAVSLVSLAACDASSPQSTKTSPKPPVSAKAQTPQSGKKQGVSRQPQANAPVKVSPKPKRKSREVVGIVIDPEMRRR